MSGKRRRRRAVATAPATAGSSRRFDWICCSLITAAVLIAFGGSLGNDFIRYDDTLYVIDNPHVRAGLSPEGLRWAATARAASNWHPLTWVSHMIDVELFGLNPEGHHLSSLVLHLINGLLLYSWLRWTTARRWRSAFVAGLFALHPLHVESVAWVAERKDVLSTMLLLLTLLAWARYAKRRRATDYALCTVLFALGLAAKPMLVTLPLLLLLLDIWPLGRTPLVPAAHPAGWSGSTASPLRLVVEKLPLLALSAASSVMTLAAQRGGGALKDTVLYPFGVRLATAVVAYAAYVVKTFAPIGLSIFYLHPRSWPGWLVAGAALGLSAVSWVALRQFRSRPYLGVGWLWFLGTLVPVIGLVQVGFQWMADRYTYIPLIGLFIAVVWGVTELVPVRLRTAALVAGLAVLALCAGASRIQGAYWKDTEQLFERAIELDPGNFPAHLVLADALMHEGRPDDAIAHFEAAVRIEPAYGPARSRLGGILVREGRTDEALTQLEAAYRLRPDHAETRFYLGLVHERLGDHERAVDYYTEGLRLKPDDREARTRLGISLHRCDRPAEAIRELRSVTIADPSERTARRYLAVLLATIDDPDLRDPSEATRLAEQASRLAGDSGLEELEALSIVLAAAERFADAADVAERLSRAARRIGRTELAVSAERRAEAYRARAATVH